MDTAVGIYFDGYAALTSPSSPEFQQGPPMHVSASGGANRLPALILDAAEVDIPASRATSIKVREANPGSTVDRSQDLRSAVATLDGGGRHQDDEEKAAGVGDDVALAAVDLLTGVVSPGQSRYRVRATERLGIQHAAGGCGVPRLAGLLLLGGRTFSRKTSWIASTVSSSRQVAKYPYTLRQCGKSLGSVRHAHPARVM